MTEDLSLDRFEVTARGVIDGLPHPFASHAQGVLLRIAEEPDASMLADLGLDDPLQLTGLYDGIPMTEKSLYDMPGPPDTVWLFRRPILANGATAGTSPSTI